MFIHNSFQIIYTYEFVRTVHVTNGVRQGGVLSPYFGCIFYDLFLELNNIKAECCIGEVLLNHLMFQEGIHAEIACPITLVVVLCTTCRGYPVLIVIRFIVTTYLL